jgi:metallo-beta-lactamase family protein
VHADSDELIAWLRNAEKPNEVFIVHGEIEGQQHMQQRLTDELGWNATIPKSGQVFQV